MSKKKYVVKKESNSVVSKKKVKSIKGFSVKPRNKVKPEEMIDVDEMILVDNDLIKILIDKKVKRNFDKILNMYMSLCDDEDAGEGDWDIVLDELDRFKKHLQAKYREYLKKEEEKKILKKIDLIKKEIINKKSLLMEDVRENKKGKGR